MAEFLKIMTEVPKAEGPILLTEIAARKIKELKKDSQNQGKVLRIYVTSGGCSGFSYNFKFDDKKASDMVFEKDGSMCVIDSKSYTLLAGSTLDYKEGLTGAGFVLKNPNAKSTCGCGSSFGV